MSTFSQKLVLIVASFTLVGTFTETRASSTDVILNLEGNPTCSSLGDNDAVLDYRDSSPADDSIILTTKEGGEQLLVYTLGEPDPDGNATIKDWSLTLVSDPLLFKVNPINYVILKAQGGSGARVFHYGAAEDGDGAITDTDLSATGSKLAAISFCYGLTAGFDEPDTPDPEPPISDCSEFTVTDPSDPNVGKIVIDGTVIGSCPVNTTEERLLISLDLMADNFDVQSCTCNVDDGLPSCDPELKVDQIPAAGEPGPCIVTDLNNSKEGVNEWVPILIQGVETPNSYICYTIGGKRTCYGHF